MSVSLEETIAKLDEVHKRGLLGIYGIKISRILKLLRELQERRKQPEIILCGECKHYKIDHPKANGYHCCYRCHNIFPMKETDFCSRAERRTDG